VEKAVQRVDHSLITAVASAPPKDAAFFVPLLEVSDVGTYKTIQARKLVRRL